MALVLDRHNTLFKSKVSELLDDLGRTITIHQKGSFLDCKWCVWDEATKSSSGIPEQGKDWSTHENYDGSGLRCPNCNGKGRIDTSITTDVEDVLIEDKSGVVFEKGKVGVFPQGTKVLIGKLASVLVDDDDLNSDTIFSSAIKVVVDGEDYIIRSVKRFGLKDLYLFEALIQLSSQVDIREEALLS